MLWKESLIKVFAKTSNTIKFKSRVLKCICIIYDERKLYIRTEWNRKRHCQLYGIFMHTLYIRKRIFSQMCARTYAEVYDKHIAYLGVAIIVKIIACFVIVQWTLLCVMHLSFYIEYQLERCNTLRWYHSSSIKTSCLNPVAYNEVAAEQMIEIIRTMHVWCTARARAGVHARWQIHWACNVEKNAFSRSIVKR